MAYEATSCDCVGIDHTDRHLNKHVLDECIHPDGYRHKLAESKEKPT